MEAMKPQRPGGEDWVGVEPTRLGWIQEFLMGGDNLKKLEKMTSAAVGRAEN